MKTLKRLAIEEFRDEAVKSEGKDIEAVVLSSDKTFETTVKTSAEDDRTLIFTISTPDVDRAGDVVAIDGWRLEEYKKTPVVLWSHRNDMPPVAKAENVWISGGKLKAQAKFTPPGNSPILRFNDTILMMYKDGFLSATSVGFQPHKYSLSKDPGRQYGIDFHDQTLLEFSCCTVPMNPNALVEARSAGIDIQPLVEHQIEDILRNVKPEDISNLVDMLAERIGKVAMEKAQHDRVNYAARAWDREQRKKRMGRDLDLMTVKGIQTA